LDWPFQSFISLQPS